MRSRALSSRWPVRDPKRNRPRSVAFAIAPQSNERG
jgi:hypothetical protein